MKDWRSRMFFSRVLLATLLLSLLYTVSNFVAPYAIPAGTAVGLDGSANLVDNGALYGSFPVFPRVVYYVGDAQCHQMASRTIMLNGNQMPMDARMTSIYAFANFGLLSAMFAAPSTSIAQGIVNALPKRLAAWGRRHLGPGALAAIIVALGILPVAADGFVQLLTPYESTNATRVLTGIPTGWIGGLLVGVMMTSIRQVGIESAALRNRTPAA